MKQLMSVVKVGNASMLQRKCNLKVSKCKENIQDAKLETGANFPEIPIRSESFIEKSWAILCHLNVDGSCGVGLTWTRAAGSLAIFYHLLPVVADVSSQCL